MLIRESVAFGEVILSFDDKSDDFDRSNRETLSKAALKVDPFYPSPR